MRAAQGGPPPTFELQGLTVRLGNSPALERIDARIGPGWTAVVGPNGAGKSTLLRALAGLQAPGAGRVLLDGADLAALAPRERGRRIAWLAQGGEFGAELTVRQTVMLGRLPHLGLLGHPEPQDEAAVDRALAQAGCAAWAQRRLQTLSGGERQRALLARALATEAPVLLLDEPTTHLDPPQQVALVRLARRMAATRTVITVLHELPLALAADQVLLLQAGRLRAHAAPSEPALHAALHTVFGGAVRVAWRDGRAWVQPEFGAEEDPIAVAGRL
jgi:iron complex transport system ATP-binding protein